MNNFIVRYFEGAIPQYFICQADDSGHAIEQCINANPEASITDFSRLHWTEINEVRI